MTSKHFILIFLFSGHISLWRIKFFIYESVSLPILAVVCPPLVLGTHLEILASADAVLAQVLRLLLNQVVLLGAQDRPWTSNADPSDECVRRELEVLHRVQTN